MLECDSHWMSGQNGRMMIKHRNQAFKVAHYRKFQNYETVRGMAVYQIKISSKHKSTKLKWLASDKISNCYILGVLSLLIKAITLRTVFFHCQIVQIVSVIYQYLKEVIAFCSWLPFVLCFYVKGHLSVVPSR